MQDSKVSRTVDQKDSQDSLFGATRSKQKVNVEPWQCGIRAAIRSNSWVESSAKPSSQRCSIRSLRAVGASGGGVLGALIGAGVTEEHAHVYAETVRRGGAIVTVRVDDNQIPVVQTIMSRRAVNPEAKATLYHSDGWTRFDPTAAPYAESERKVETTTVRRTTSPPSLS